MDRSAYEQLDRMERKLDALIMKLAPDLVKQPEEKKND